MMGNILQISRDSDLYRALSNVQTILNKPDLVPQRDLFIGDLVTLQRKIRVLWTLNTDYRYTSMLSNTLSLIIQTLEDHFEI